MNFSKAYISLSHKWFIVIKMLGAIYPTKKALKESVGKPLRYEETSFFGEEFKTDGKFCVVGPSPRVRKWFATVTMKNGLIEKVQ